MSRSDHRCRAGAPARTAIAGLVAVRTVACGGRSPEDRVSKAIGYAVEDCRENGLTRVASFLRSPGNAGWSTGRSDMSSPSRSTTGSTSSTFIQTGPADDLPSTPSGAVSTSSPRTAGPGARPTGTVRRTPCARPGSSGPTRRQVSVTPGLCRADRQVFGPQYRRGVGCERCPSTCRRPRQRRPD